MINMVDFVIGAGQGGCRIAKAFSEEFGVSAAYMNLAKIDFSQLDVPRSASLLIDEGGTGRDPIVGEKFARKHKEKITTFLSSMQIEEEAHVIVSIGGGGGSGAGMMATLLDFLLKLKCHVLLVYTLPEKKEGLPAKPNALKSLNKVIQKYLIPKRITALVIDNDFCVKYFGVDQTDSDAGEYWGEINFGIVRGLQKFWYLTNLEKYTNYIDVNAGYGALDSRELERIMYHKGGFLDLREFSCDAPDVDLAKSAKFQSRVFGNLDIGTTKQYIVTVGFPYSMRNDDRVPQFLEALFKKLERVTKTSFVLRSSHFNKKLSKIWVNILLSGLIQSHGLKKIISQTAKDIEKYKEKNEVEMLDLSILDGEIEQEDIDG